MTRQPHVWLDLTNGDLWRGNQANTLRPKTLKVLRYLLNRPNQVVSSAEILAAVWPETVVSTGVLKNCVLELRKALGDTVRAPQYLATIPRRGYRLIKPIVPIPSIQGSAPTAQKRAQAEEQNPESHGQHINQLISPLFHPPFGQTVSLVGREKDLAHLHKKLALALEGECQLVFVVGEPGVGKTAVIEAFLQQVAAQPALWIAQGQCIEHLGTSEPYLPILEALGRLGQGSGRQLLVSTIHRYAPTWLAELPVLLTPTDREQLRGDFVNASRERMLREIAVALVVLTCEVPLVLILEDLHWSDDATIDFLSYIARQKKPARLMIIGTCRPIENFSLEHPLRGIKQELEMHGLCQELVLGPLDEAAVEEYLVRRFSGKGNVSTTQLARALHRRTEGHPFFLVRIVNELIARKVLIPTEKSWTFQGELSAIASVLPDSIRQLVKKQIDQLSPEERQVIEAGSVAGMEFSAAAVAAGLAQEISRAEEICEGLAQRHLFIYPTGRGVFRDRRKSSRYGFSHSLCRDVVYTQLAAGRRVLLHQRIGLWEESTFGSRVGERAATLALHFERGQEYRKAVYYRKQAARLAARRYAYREAIDHLTTALELLKTVPDTPERAQQEVLLQTTLGAQLTATKGYATPEVEYAYSRARELCQQLDPSPQSFPALFGLFAFHLARAELKVALELAEQFYSLIDHQQDSVHLTQAHCALGLVFLYRGELVSAQAHLEQATALYDPQSYRSYILARGQDPGVASSASLTQSLWLRGYAGQALNNAREAFTLAQTLICPLGVALALHFMAQTHQLCRNHQAAQSAAEAAIAISREHGFPFWCAAASIVRGGALVEQGRENDGIEQLLQGTAAYLATGAKVSHPYWLSLLAETYRKVGRIKEGLGVIADALTTAHSTGERWWEANLLRLKGELLLESNRHRAEPEVKRAAETLFLQALDTAYHQQARALELRAAISLSRLWQQQKKKKQAYQILTKIYSGFTEGFDTPDLQEARELLQKMS